MLGQQARPAVILRAIGLAALVGLLLGSTTTVGAQVDDTAGLRIVHVGIDTPPVHVALDGEALAEDLFWLEATDYLEVPAGDHELTLFDPDTSLDEPLTSATVTTMAGSNYSVVITGELPEPTIALLADGDPGGIESGSGAVRFFHSVPDAGPLDVVTSDGMQVAEGVEPLTASPYIMLLPGTYDIAFREAGTDTVLYTEAGVTVEGGAFQTTFLSGLAELTNFAAETFIDEFREAAGGGEATPTTEPGPTITPTVESTATEAPQPTATTEPTATLEPPPTATPTPAVGMPSTGAGGTATQTSETNLLLIGTLALLCLAGGSGLFLWTRRVS